MCSVSYAERRRNGQAPAHCVLFDTSIVDGFQTGCPLGAENPFNALFILRKRGFEELDQDIASEAGNDLLHRDKVCNGCVPQMLTHAVVRRLRGRADPSGVNEAPYA